MSSSRHRYREHLAIRAKCREVAKMYSCEALIIVKYSEFFWEYLIYTGIQWKGNKSQVNLFQVDGELTSYTRRNWQTAPPKATTVNYSFQLVPL